MSIWSTTEVIGDDDDMPLDRTQLGDVRSYAVGWSNHYPDTVVERPAMLDLAEIPPWCVPGHRDAEQGVGGWLRLGVHTWLHDPHAPRDHTRTEHVSADVVLDVKAATQLRDALTRWLNLDHLDPKEA